MEVLIAMGEFVFCLESSSNRLSVTAVPFSVSIFFKPFRFIKSIFTATGFRWRSNSSYLRLFLNNHLGNSSVNIGEAKISLWARLSNSQNLVLFL